MTKEQQLEMVKKDLNELGKQIDEAIANKNEADYKLLESRRSDVFQTYLELTR